MDLVSIILLCAGSLLAGVLDATVGGGGFIVIPALVFLGYPIAAAIGTSRIIFFLDSGSALVGHARKRNILWRTAALYCVLAVFAAQAGAHYTANTDSALMERLFGLFMVATIILFAVKPKMGLTDLRHTKGWTCGALAGAFIGFLIGFFGGGVGSIIIIALVMVSGLTVLQASGTSQLIVWVANISAIIAYWRLGLMDVRLGIILGACAFAGAQAGVYVAHRIGNARLKQLLFAVASVSAVKLLL